MKIESFDVSLEKLLQGNYFVIPRFQRPYSWETEQITEFWNDIVSTIEQDSYFIGSIVVYTQKDGKLALVDGQQRLTTLAIFLSSIRDMFERLGNNDSALGLHQFIERKNVDNKNVYVLETQSSFPFLQETVFSMEPPDAPVEVGKEELAIQRAYSIFNDNLDIKVASFLEDPTVEDHEERNENAQDWLRKVREAVLNLSIIQVTLDNEDDAYLIFETLNTRGKDLALSDLLKNHFVRLLKSKGAVDKAKLKWEDILKTIDGSSVDLDPDNFIVHSWQSRFDAVTKGKAFKKIRATIKQKNAKTHLDEFCKDAPLWRSIFEPSYKFTEDKPILRSLNALRDFRVVQPVPGILSLLRAQETKAIKPKKVRKTLQAIEHFHFGFTAVTSSRSSGGISGMYSSFGRRLFEAKDSNEASDVIADLIAKLRERVPSQTEYDAGFEQLVYTNEFRSYRKVVRYALMKIAKFEQQPFIGDTEDLTIEHLYPQALISNEMPSEVVGQLGNLMLVDPKTNEELKDKPFSEKKEILLQRGYKLPDIFMDAEELSQELIQANTLRLSNISRENVWKI